MPQTVKVGQTILAADGSLVLTVKEILPDGVMTTVTNSCTIGERKNMNLPGVIVDLPTVTEKDKDDLINFGLKYVAALWQDDDDEIQEQKSTTTQQQQFMR